MLMAHRPHKFRALSKPKNIHKREHRHYLPYLPLLLILISSFLAFTVRPLVDKGVLAYATNMSVDQLLVATNQQRKQHNTNSLIINQTLNAAAQAKANDMVARNYWSHNTPDGQEPWVFLNSAGYKYIRAGENLAYGFDTSDDTVSGWMNSPAHKANLTDNNFTEVGFGFANAKNFNSSGPETVIVAMYGKPQSSAAGVSSNQISAQEMVTMTPQASDNVYSAVTSDRPVINEPSTTAIAKVQAATNGSAPWTMFAVGLIIGISLVILLIKHAAGVRHFLRDGEQFVLHHPVLDTVLVCMVLAGSYLSQTTGFIR